MNQLAEHLKGFANSLEKGWMTEWAVYGALLILLTSSGYLKLKEQHYVKEEHGIKRNP